MPGLEDPRSSSASTESTSSRYSINSTTIELVTMESEDESGDGNDSKVSDIKKHGQSAVLPGCSTTNSDLPIDAELLKQNRTTEVCGVNDIVSNTIINDNIPNTGCCQNSETYTGNGSVVSNEDNCAVVGCDTPNNTTNEQKNQNQQGNMSGESVCSNSNGTGEQNSEYVSNEDNCHPELMPGSSNVSGTDSKPNHLDFGSLVSPSSQPNDLIPTLQSDSKEGTNTLPNALADKGDLVYKRHSEEITESPNAVPSEGDLIYERKPKNPTSGNEMMVYPEVHAPDDSNTQTDTKPDSDESETESVTDEYEEQMGIESYNGISEYVPKAFWKTPLKCLSYGTVRDISYRLDPTDEIEAARYGKDFTGLCDRLNLDPAFIKYLVKSNIKLKTEEVLSKWEVFKPGEGPRPTVGNFAKIVYYDLDRPDVIADLQEKIVQDAEKFEKTKTEAATDRPGDEDRSWELTRHDVLTGKKTHYTCCLCYADEDEGMATLITNFFQTVCGGNTRFFRPQFDLKMGKYTYDTTARVIEERCNGKVIFLLSDYFYANPICQFAVNFAHSRNPAAEQGNLIPFYLSNKYETAPKVLKGIAGVRWARKQFRYHSWGQLSDCLMTRSDDKSQASDQSELSKIQERIKVELDSSSSEWLCDPPYDEDTPAPGPALPLNEPPDDPTNSSSNFDPDAVDDSQLVNSDAQISTKWYRRFMNRVRNAVSNLRSPRQNRAPRRSRPIRPEELNKAFVEDRDPPDLV